MTVTPSTSTPVTPALPGAPGTDVSQTAVETAGLFAQLMAALVPQTAAEVPAPEEQSTQDRTPDAPVAPTPPVLVATPGDPSPLHNSTGPTASLPGRKMTATVAAGTTADSSVAVPATEAVPPATTPSAMPPTVPAAVAATPVPAAAAPRPRSASAEVPAEVPGALPASPAATPLPTPTDHGPKAGAEPVPVETSAGPAPGLPSPVAPTGVPTPAPAGQPAPTAATAVPPVSRQVIPELTRMSTLGEGVHRLTMTLRPEALGEVRVTMTVRDGSLHVRLAAGTEARHALVPDLTELQQVLKLGSGNDVRVVLRDLAGVPAAPEQQFAQTGGQQGHHTGHGAPTGQDPGTTAGSGQHSRREAGTPRDTHATDGAVDGTSGSRAQAVRRVRPTGVDLTM